MVTSLIAMGGCTANFEVATLHVPDQQLSLSVSRQQSHWYLPEYNRRIQLGSPERELSCVLPMDTGGIVRINVYRASPTRYILRDRVEAFEIDRDLQRDCGDLPLSEVKGVFVGSFDEVDGRWQFVPASERAELAFEAGP